MVSSCLSIQSLDKIAAQRWNWLDTGVSVATQILHEGQLCDNIGGRVVVVVGEAKILFGAALREPIDEVRACSPEVQAILVMLP
jgi:hypothetical protein